MTATGDELARRLREAHDGLEVTPRAAPTPGEASSLAHRSANDPRNRLAGRGLLAAAAAIAVLAMAAATAVVVARRDSQQVTAGPAGKDCEPLPTVDPEHPGRSLPLRVSALPPGWVVLDDPLAAVEGGIAVGQAGATSLVASSATRLPLISLSSVADESQFVNDYDRGDVYRRSNLTSPGGRTVRLWTPDGQPLPQPNFAARWELPSGAVVEAYGLYLVTAEQLLTVIDGVSGPSYCDLEPRSAVSSTVASAAPAVRLLSCGSGPPFARAAIEEPDPAMFTAAEVESVRRFAQEHGQPVGELWLLARDDDGALVADRGASEVSPEAGFAPFSVWTLHRVGDGMVPLGFGGCRLSAMVDGLVASRWELDPKAPPPGPFTTQLPVVVHESACASGQTAAGRIRTPSVSYGPDAVEIAITVTPPTGSQDCSSNPPTPYVVELREPLGDRQILDSGREPISPPGP